jgi:hypothetical protein
MSDVSQDATVADAPAAPPTEREKLDAEAGHFGMWINDNIVGNPITFIIAILSVVIVYAAIPLVGGYTKWNTGLGLFFNTLSSSFELITGVGAVVGVVVLHKSVKAHRASSRQHFAEIHEKLDALMGENVPPKQKDVAVEGMDGLSGQP